MNQIYQTKSIQSNLQNLIQQTNSTKTNREKQNLHNIEVKSIPSWAELGPVRDFFSTCSLLVHYLFITCSLLIHRHAKSWEPGNLVPGHFWRKIWTFFRNQSIKEINLRFFFGFVDKRMPVSLHFYLNHHHMYSYKPLVCKFVRINCPDISRLKFRFPDKNCLFECLDILCI